VACILTVGTGAISINLVKSNSMSPTLAEGDIVAWTPIDIKDVEVGDVVVFKSYMEWPDEKLIVHRVTDVLEDSNGNTVLETKGDNSDLFDQAGPNFAQPYIRSDHLMGKALSIGKEPLKIPYFLLISMFMISALIVVVSLLLYQIRTKKLKTIINKNTMISVSTSNSC
jgi:signal peptidase I